MLNVLGSPARSQNSRSSRAAREMLHRIEKLENRLADGYERPKGMHRRTYDRLCSVIAELEVAADTLFVEKIYRRWPDLLVS